MQNLIIIVMRFGLVYINCVYTFVSRRWHTCTTRWHDDDLAGRLLRTAEDGADQWEVVKYPALAEAEEEFIHMTLYIQKDTMQMH